MGETSSSQTVCTKLERIATMAREMPRVQLHTLAHHIDLDWLREAYRRTRKDGAPGVDGRTAEQYAQDLEGNLRALLERVKAGTYRAPPWIYPKIRSRPVSRWYSQSSRSAVVSSSP